MEEQEEEEEGRRRGSRGRGRRKKGKQWRRRKKKVVEEEEEDSSGGGESRFLYMIWIRLPKTGVVSVPIHTQTGIYCLFCTISGGMAVFGLKFQF